MNRANRKGFRIDYIIACTTRCYHYVGNYDKDDKSPPFCRHPETLNANINNGVDGRRDITDKDIGGNVGFFPKWCPLEEVY
jgi:hypothetical protein